MRLSNEGEPLESFLAEGLARLGDAAPSAPDAQALLGRLRRRAVRRVAFSAAGLAGIGVLVLAVAMNLPPPAESPPSPETKEFSANGRGNGGAHEAPACGTEKHDETEPERKPETPPEEPPPRPLPEAISVEAWPDEVLEAARVVLADFGVHRAVVLKDGGEVSFCMSGSIDGSLEELEAALAALLKNYDLVRLRVDTDEQAQSAMLMVE